MRDDDGEKQTDKQNAMWGNVWEFEAEIMCSSLDVGLESTLSPVDTPTALKYGTPFGHSLRLFDISRRRKRYGSRASPLNSYV